MIKWLYHFIKRVTRNNCKAIERIIKKR